MEIPNRIKINSKYWIVIQSDKLILGGFYDDPNIHLTIMFGIKSGILDIHLTKNKNGGKSDHFRVLRISHKDLFQLLPIWFKKATESFYSNKRDLDFDWLEKNNFKVFFVRGYDRVFEVKLDTEIDNIISVFNKTKRRIHIDKENIFLEKKINSIAKKIEGYIINNLHEVSTLKSMRYASGLLISESKVFYFFKDQNNNIEFIADSLDLLLENIFANIFGEVPFKKVKKRILEGVRLFELGYNEENLDRNDGFDVSFEIKKNPT